MFRFVSSLATVSASGSTCGVASVLAVLLLSCCTPSDGRAWVRERAESRSAGSLPAVAEVRERSERAAVPQPSPPVSLSLFAITDLDEAALGAERPRVRQLARVRIFRDRRAESPTFEAQAAIKYRGASSLNYEQKSFAVEFRDDQNREIKRRPLGLQAGSDWVLVACWLDRTCMRNALAYRLGHAFGRWSPALRWVEVSVNGNYRGIYQLVEAIRSGSHRLNLVRPAPESLLGDITGDYVFRREHAGKSRHEQNPRLAYDWVSAARDPNGRRSVFTHHYPRHDDLTEGQRQYLHTFVAQFEEGMYRGAARGQKLETLLDIPSWVDYALATEWSHDVDGWMKSMYFIKRADAVGVRLELTPLWDYNLAFGQVKVRDANNTALWQHDAGNRDGFACSPLLATPAGCRACRRGLKCGNLAYIPYWALQLFKNPVFTDALACRWRQLRHGPLADAVMFSTLRRWHNELRLAMREHFGRWPRLLKHGLVARPAGREPRLVPKSPLSHLVRRDDDRARRQFGKEVAWLAEWIRRRNVWLDHELGTCHTPKP